MSESDPDGREEFAEPAETPSERPAELPEPEFLTRSQKEDVLVDEVLELRKKLGAAPGDEVLEKLLREKKAALEVLTNQSTFAHSLDFTLGEVQKFGDAQADKQGYTESEQSFSEQQVIKPIERFNSKSDFQSRSRARKKGTAGSPNERQENSSLGVREFRKRYDDFKRLERAILILMAKMPEDQVSTYQKRIEGITEPLREKLYRALPPDFTLDEIQTGKRIPDLPEEKWEQHFDKVNAAYGELYVLYAEIFQKLSPGPQ